MFLFYFDLYNIVLILITCVKFGSFSLYSLAVSCSLSLMYSEAPTTAVSPGSSFVLGFALYSAKCSGYFGHEEFWIQVSSQPIKNSAVAPY